jgi:hypothetical protein
VQLADPGADSIAYWDDSDGLMAWVGLGGNITISGGNLVTTVTSGAPTDADYLVRTANGSLSAERVVTDTDTVDWDWGTGGQAKANVNVQMSITSDSSGLLLDGDEASPGASEYYGTSADAVKGFWPLSASGGPVRYTVTKSYTDLAAASTANDIEILSLPAGGVVWFATLRHTTTFSGGGIVGYIVNLGKTGTENHYVSGRSVSGAVVDTFTSMIGGFKRDDASNAISIRLFADSTGANLNAATAGSVNIDIWYSV